VIYGTFHAWLDDVVTQARFDRRITSINGWPLEVHGDTRDRTLMNYPARSSGSDLIRHAAICAVESGIPVCCSVHDSFKELAPLETVERTMREMGELMRAAGAAITGSFEIPAETKVPVRSPQRQADLWTSKDKGLRMWVEVQARLDSGELPEANKVDDDDGENAEAAAAS
jgi:hypothetical protein